MNESESSSPESPAKEQPTAKDEIVEAAWIRARSLTAGIYGGLSRLLDSYVKPCPEKCNHANCPLLHDLYKLRDEHRAEYLASEPAKEQPGEQNAAPQELRAGEGSPSTRSASISDQSSAVAAPDVAAMVKELTGQRIADGANETGLLGRAAAMIEKLGQPQPVHRECEKCGMLVACWSDAQIEAIERDAAMIRGKIKPPHRSAHDG